MKRLVSILLIVGIITTLALVGLVACKDTRTGYPDGDKYTAGAGTYSAANVSKLNVAWTAGTANVTFTDEVTDIQITEENNFTDEAYLLHHYLDPQGTLWVKPLAASVGDDEIPTFTTKILTIKFPKKALEEVYVENHGAKTYIDGVNASKLETYNSGYDTAVTNANVGELKTKGDGTGDTRVSGRVTGKVNMSSGQELSLYTSAMPTEITMTGKISATLTIPETDGGFKATITKSSPFTCGFEPIVESAAEEETKIVKTYKGGAVAINITCNQGIIRQTNNIKILKYTAA
ncbi:MAG: hypothetical protein K5923_03475 [Clostridia bacterium]|nr:hypothetical protein [Clostridia bacterium]